MSNWEEFAKRCAENVRKIRETKDDGVYAKLYADDVDRLLRMLEAAEDSDLDYSGSMQDLFEETK